MHVIHVQVHASAPISETDRYNVIVHVRGVDQDVHKNIYFLTSHYHNAFMCTLFSHSLYRIVSVHREKCACDTFMGITFLSS